MVAGGAGAQAARPPIPRAAHASCCFSGAGADSRRGWVKAAAPRRGGASSRGRGPPRRAPPPAGPAARAPPRQASRATSAADARRAGSRRGLRPGPPASRRPRRGPRWAGRATGSQGRASFVFSSPSPQVWKSFPFGKAPLACLLAGAGLVSPGGFPSGPSPPWRSGGGGPWEGDPLHPERGVEDKPVILERVQVFTLLTWGLLLSLFFISVGMFVEKRKNNLERVHPSDSSVPLGFLNCFINLDVCLGFKGEMQIEKQTCPGEMTGSLC
ncbi:translation initiation factor IF-2-like [Lemur catta]|uniref:translation initiation factor IF-2-like n=1 Tax=Lemur catta TaxID=9447 RepID=UPI001E2676D0|nr:translation initiation factor IF-2-like [Lemur catta]